VNEKSPEQADAYASYQAKFVDAIDLVKKTCDNPNKAKNYKK
jgi:hypothetical protein